jgi:hypothetical protein
VTTAGALALIGRVQSEEKIFTAGELRDLDEELGTLLIDREVQARHERIIGTSSSAEHSLVHLLALGHKRLQICNLEGLHYGF